MKTVGLRATSWILTAALAVFTLPLAGMPGHASGEDAATKSSRLPKVETDFSVIEHPTGFDAADKKTFAAMIPASDVMRIILWHDRGFDAEQKVRADPDRFFEKITRSQVTGTSWGLDALERPVAEYLVITKTGDVFKVTALGFGGSATARVTGVWLFGKGFSRRFDFRQAPLECGKQD